jgi:hypothetical protein
MTSEANRKIHDAILAEMTAALEAASHGDVPTSVAISLRRIADKLDEVPTKAPPKIVHR